MHGLIFRSFQSFVTLTYGAARWGAVLRRAKVPFAEFEAMLHYEPALVETLLTATEEELEKSRDHVLEDVGTFLVAHPQMDSVRRLLRFGGTSYDEFLHSLDDLAGRTRLAVPDLDLPDLMLRDECANEYSLYCTHPMDIFGPVLVGLLRAMADDYGSLACLDHRGRKGGVDCIGILLVDLDFAVGKTFDLSAGVRDRRVAAK